MHGDQRGRVAVALEAHRLRLNCAAEPKKPCTKITGRVRQRNVHLGAFPGVGLREREPDEHRAEQHGDGNDETQRPFHMIPPSPDPTC